MSNISDFIRGVVYLEEKLIDAVDGSKRDNLKILISSFSQYIKQNKNVVQESDYLKCMKVINKCIDSDDFSDEKINKIFKNVHKLKEHLVSHKSECVPLDINALSKKLMDVQLQMEEVAEIRKELKTLRNEAKSAIHSNLKGEKEIVEFGKHTGKKFNAILGRIISHAAAKLERRGMQKPELEKWAVVVLGSLARQEGHAYSDVDMLILIDHELEQDPAVKKYFSSLMQEISDLIYQVGEEFSGFKLCGGNMVPPFRSFQDRYPNAESPGAADHLGMGSFISSPENLAIAFYQSAISFMPLKGKASVYKTPISRNEELIGAALLDQNVIYGNTTLLQRFKELKIEMGKLKVTDMFDVSRFEDAEWGKEITAEQLAYRTILVKAIANRKASDFERLELNIKKDFIRPIQLAISVLANQFGIESAHTVDRIDGLVEKGILKKEDAEIVKSTYLQLYKMRIVGAVTFAEENDRVTFSDEVFEDAELNLKNMSQELSNLHQQEAELIKSKRSGIESMRDLAQIRLRQDAYANECLYLFKLLTLRKKMDRVELEAPKQLVLHIINKLHGYIKLNCDKKALDQM